MDNYGMEKITSDVDEIGKPAVLTNGVAGFVQYYM